MTDQSKAKEGLDARFNDILTTAKPSEAVLAAVRMCSSDTSGSSEAILALDQRFFCTESTAKTGERIEAVLTLMQIFVADADENSTEDGEEIPVSMRRALPKTDQGANQEANVFKRFASQAEQLTERFIAGICLLDIVSYSW